MGEEDKKLNKEQGGDEANLDTKKGADDSDTKNGDGGEANISEKEYNEAVNRAKGLDATVSKLQAEKDEAQK